MQIRIDLADLDPPTGTVQSVSNASPTAANDNPKIAFGGWLGMMRALSELISSSA